MTLGLAQSGVEESIVVSEGVVGILARPLEGRTIATIGVVIVVGGPQTRVGSHRQFVTLSRALASAGYACLRFDYTGMGDSAGAMPNFESAAPDIRRACDALLESTPDCRSIAIWGLCDGATASLFYSLHDDRVAIVFAANPWARSASTRSEALVRSHYRSRIRSLQFWGRLLSGKIAVLSSLRESVGHWRAARDRSRSTSSAGSNDLPQRLDIALNRSPARVRVQLSGKDLTAAEFEIAAKGWLSTRRGSALRLETADHTFSEPNDWTRIIDDVRATLDGSVQRRMP